MDTILVLIGVGCIIGGIIGGGLKLQVIEMGKLESLWRQALLAGFGVVLTIFGLVMGGKVDPFKSNAPQPQIATRSAEPLASPQQPSSRPQSPPVEANGEKSNQLVVADENTQPFKLAEVYWSSIEKDDASNTVGSFYADRVKYFGRVLGRDEVVEQKQSYFRRFPIRTYKITQADTDCLARSCTVRGIVRWSGATSSMTTPSQGASKFSLTFEGGKIVSETSSPL